jgi:putative ABC transport system permease protein
MTRPARHPAARLAEGRDLVLRDLRYAARGLRRNPGFATLAILSLAVGIGATTAVFSVMDATLLRPLPFREPARLMALVLRVPRGAPGNAIDMTWSYPKYLAFSREQQLFDDVGLYITESVTAGGADGAERIPGEAISARYLDVLGVHPVFGPGVRWDDDGVPAEPAVLLGQGFWRRRFAADRGAIGQPIELDGRRFTVAGVLPAGFRGMSGHAELFVPIPLVRSRSSLTQAGAHQYSMVAHLRPGTTVAQARDGMTRWGGELARRFSGSGSDWGARAYTLDETRLDPRVRQAVTVVAAAVVVVLLITCANLAGLLLARGARRRREVAVRLAIGARRGQLVRQLLTESALLAIVGAAASLAVAWVSVRALSAIAPVGAQEFAGAFADDVSGLTAVGLQSVRIDTTALLFTAAVALAAPLLFGLVPALRGARADLGDAMRVGATAEPAFGGVRRLTGRGVLVVAEIALAFVLLVSSGLLVRSLTKLFDTGIGADATPVLTARVSLPSRRAEGDTAGLLWPQLLERVAAIPGVLRAGLASCAPVSTECEGTSIGVAPGDEVPVGLHGASPGYFEALGVPLHAGRTFAAVDRAGLRRSVVINERAARMFWPGVSPVGRTAVVFGDTATVVGVVGDVRYDRMEEAPRPAIYLALAQRPMRSAVLFVRTAADPMQLAGALRAAIRALDPADAVYDVKAMTVRMGDATARTRFAAIVLATFAGVALTLAMLGVYGVLSLAVEQRTRELGVRMALGATGGRVQGMLLAQGLALAALGGAAGLVVATGTSRLLGSLVYGVSPLDPSTYGAIAGLTLATAALAAVMPARRAARKSIVTALKAD